MTPVIVLTDGGIANSSEVGAIPAIADLPPFDVKFRTDPEGYQVYERDHYQARAWVRPGTPGMEHRIGGLEKHYLSGEVSADGPNHERMVKLRAEKIAGIAKSYAPLQVEGDRDSELLIVSWGSTYGSVAEAVRRSLAAGKAVAHVHLRHVNPLPNDLGEIISRYKQVLVPEINLGQLSVILRNAYVRDFVGFNRVEGRPLRASELCDAIAAMVQRGN
jgi:2-oxoglutarate ferredoxin oxidoreductase subunit alpha